MGAFRRIRCFFSGLSSFCRIGIWLDHLYKLEDLHPAMIWHNDNSWAEVDTFRRTDGTVEFGYVETCKCVYCGKVQKSWCKNRDLHVLYSSDEIAKFLTDKNNKELKK